MDNKPRLYGTPCNLCGLPRCGIEMERKKRASGKIHERAKVVCVECRKIRSAIHNRTRVVKGKSPDRPKIERVMKNAPCYQDYYDSKEKELYQNLGELIMVFNVVTREQRG